MDTFLRLPDGADPRIYFVDLDGTLLSTSSEKFFLKHLVKKGILSARGCLRFLALYALHPRTTLREGKGWNRSYLAGIPLETVRDEAMLSAAMLAKNSIRDWTLQSIKDMKNAGCKIVLLSASLEYIAAGIALKVPVDNILASKPEIAGGKFTGQLTGPRPWGQSKAELMMKFCEERKVLPEHCAAAGDSWADRFVLEKCGASAAVCPDRKLRRQAKKKGWIIVEGRHTRWA